MKINILKCLYSLKKSTIHNWKKYLYQSNERVEFLQENLQKNMQEKDEETQGGAGKNPAPLHQAKTPRCETRKSCYSGSSGSTGGRFLPVW